MRIAWVEIRLRPNPHDWAVELWQWPHQNFVKLHKVKTAFFGIHIGPAEVRFWLFKPGQYAIVPAKGRSWRSSRTGTRLTGSNPYQQRRTRSRLEQALPPSYRG